MEYTVISEETVEELTLFDMASGRGGEADYVGVDIFSNILITNRDRIDLTVAYLQAEVSAMTFIYEYNPPLDIAGGPLNNAPEWSFTAGYQHEFSLPGGGTLTPRVETRYQDESFVTMNAIIDADENLMVPEGMDPYKVNIQKAYTLTNASIRYNHTGGKWSINGYVKNIENVAVKKNLIRNMAMRIGPPRTMGVVLSVQY
jgi:iron complex outermembrane receptor protein